MTGLVPRAGRTLLCWMLAAGVALVACTPSESGRGPSTGFGVMVPGGHGDASGIVDDLGAKWVRINVNLGQLRPDPRWYLDRGVDVILTVSNRDPNDAVQSYGSPAQWPRAGFPYRSADAYASELRSVLTPLVASVSAGRHVWVQCENEVFDARVAGSVFWRGTTAQYLTLEKTCHDTTKSVDPAMRVALSSFSSAGLQEAVSGGPGAQEHRTFYETLLHDASYDAADLHFYGCVSDIPPKVRWVKQYLARNTHWISTENGGPDSRCPSTPATWEQNPAAFERTEATQVSERLGACASSGGTVCLWFALFDLQNEHDFFATHLGLVDESSSPPREKPAYAAFRAFAGAHT